MDKEKEKHYLLKIMEECMEVGQRASKAHQFGINEIQKDQPFTNQQRIIHELNDLFAVVEEALQCDILDLIDKDQMALKIDRVEKYFKYQKSLK